MKIKYGYFDSIGKAFSELTNKDLSTKRALQVARFFKQFATEYQTFTDMRIKICISCSELDEKGNPVMIPGRNGTPDFKIDPNKQEEFNSKINELFSDEVEMDFNPLFDENVFNVPGMRITPETLMTLSDLGFMVTPIETSEKDKENLKALKNEVKIQSP